MKNRETETQIELEDEKLANTEYMGLIELNLTLIPKYSYNPHKMNLNISVYDYDSSSINHNFIGKWVAPG